MENYELEDVDGDRIPDVQLTDYMKEDWKKQEIEFEFENSEFKFRMCVSLKYGTASVLSLTQKSSTGSVLK